MRRAAPASRGHQTSQGDQSPAGRGVGIVEAMRHDFNQVDQPEPPGGGGAPGYFRGRFPTAPAKERRARMLFQVVGPHGPCIATPRHQVRRSALAVRCPRRGHHVPPSHPHLLTSLCLQRFPHSAQFAPTQFLRGPTHLLTSYGQPQLEK